MYYCNCGEIMRKGETLDYPKSYHCPKCYGTLIINKNGIRQWYDKNGKMSTYAPKRDK